MLLFFIVLSVCSFSPDQGVFSADTGGVSVFVMEGDSVTLNTGIKKAQKNKIKWYFKDIRIAQINGDQSKICTDVQCNEGIERFRDRLKLVHQTGSLTIMNITNTDSGEYELKIVNDKSDSKKIFNVSVHDVPAAERHEIQKKEGESVTLYSGVIKNTNNEIMWCLNGILMAKITGNQSKICTDDQCDERFRDRLKLDHQTGSLTIKKITYTDTGLYQVWTTSSSISRHRRNIDKNVKSFNVTIIDSGRSRCAVTGLFVLLLVSVAVGLIYNRWSSRNGCR